MDDADLQYPKMLFFARPVRKLLRNTKVAMVQYTITYYIYLYYFFTIKRVCIMPVQQFRLRSVGENMDRYFHHRL